MKIMIAVFSFFLIFSFLNSAPAALKESGCVKCHTDEATLKSLFKPPKISLEEGEG